MSALYALKFDNSQVSNPAPNRSNSTSRRLRSAQRPLIRINPAIIDAEIASSQIIRADEAIRKFIRKMRGARFRLETAPASNVFETVGPADLYYGTVEREAEALRLLCDHRNVHVRNIARRAIEKCGATFGKLLSTQIRADFSNLPPWKRKALSAVGKGGASFHVLSRELSANAHKYPGLTQFDLALAWARNTGSAEYLPSATFKAVEVAP